MAGNIKIAPSILSADFSKLGDEIRSVERAGASLIHVDVMDGHFVPNITMGPCVVKSLKKVAKVPLDVHLMISDPEKYIPAFCEAGAGLISFHVEATPHADRCVQLIKSFGLPAGVALNPATPLSVLDYLVGHVDFILIMTVNPGFGGQKFIETGVAKVRETRDYLKQKGLNLPIEVDGGVSVSNIASLVKAGADWFVAGSSVFGSSDPARAVKDLLKAAG